ncbi:50S ribosomal protein L9 [Petrocella atlantisensis]|uniref:Large ribosomal subunit protein bL9 n=1 Tax=Petrocella atlantisensis TaxID=2173034 RepID=A0A3P7NX79_9FIRM|nr:50S ribosomal protein L9 [Petrocella atlantisensis]VDN47834.1 50S ribosomal protein L9 [Petrocella atlantisensis]
MKIVLLEDVKKVGKKGDIVEVSDGYGRNYLIARKLGKEATNAAINDVKLKKATEARKKEDELNEAKELGLKIKASSITLAIKAGEGGKTFGSVSTKEIAKAVSDQLGIEVDKKKMVLDEPIKSLGTHIIKIKLHPKVTTELSVKVEGE